MWETAGVFVLGIGAGWHNSQGAWPGDARGIEYFGKQTDDRKEK